MGGRGGGRMPGPGRLGPGRGTGLVLGPPGLGRPGRLSPGLLSGRPGWASENVGSSNAAVAANIRRRLLAVAPAPARAGRRCCRKSDSAVGLSRLGSDARGVGRLVRLSFSGCRVARRKRGGAQLRGNGRGVSGAVACSGRAGSRFALTIRRFGFSGPAAAWCACRCTRRRAASGSIPSPCAGRCPGRT